MTAVNVVKKMVDLKVAECVPTLDNPRTINEAAPGFQELVESVKRQGVLVAVAARPIGDAPGEIVRGVAAAKKGEPAPKYEVLYGERRLRAARLAGLETIPAIVHEGLTEEQAFELTFGENFNREDLTPVEEAKAVAILLRKCGGKVMRVCEKLGKSERAVRRRMRLQALSEGWVKANGDAGHVASRMGIEHLELLAMLPKAVQDQKLKEWDEDPFELYEYTDSSERLVSVTGFEEVLCRQLKVIGKAPWVAECAGCPNRSDAKEMVELWGEAGPVVKLCGAQKSVKGPKCLDPECWYVHQKAYVESRAAELEKEHGKKLKRVTKASYAERTALSKGALQAHEFEVAKKSDKDAVPALVVEGTGAGKVEWIRPHTRASGAPKKKELTDAQKRARLRKVRWHAVIEKLRRTIKTMRPPADDMVLAMAAVFGASCGGWLSGVTRDWSDWKKTWPLTKASRNRCMKRLWEMVRPRLQNRLNVYSRPEDTDPAKITEAKKLAELLGVDLKPLHEAAEKKFPAPKKPAKKKAKKTAGKKGAKKTAKKSVKGKK